MRKVREVLRLKHAVGLSYREISEATGVGKTAVGEYIRRAEVIGIRGQCRMGSTTPRPSGLHLGHS
jgi:transposase